MSRTNHATDTGLRRRELRVAAGALATDRACTEAGEAVLPELRRLNA